MAKPTRHVPRVSSRRRIWVYVAVAAFLLVDILLIAWALTGTRADAKVSAHRPIPTYSATPRTTAPTANPTPTPTASRSTEIVPVPPTRILAAFDGTTAWRAETGACPAVKASPELTTDSGESWKSTDATGPTEVTALQRIKVSGPRVASMIGFSEADCSPQFVKTYVAGDSFKSYPEEVDTSWYVDPADRDTVHGPAGEFKAPCDSVIMLAPRDADAAAVLCADGEVFATADAAKTWSRPATLAGVINISVAQGGYIAAAAGRADCAGVQILPLSPELESGKAGCYPTKASLKSLSGKVALSEADGIIWLWAGDALARSSDEGVTWS